MKQKIAILPNLTKNTQKGQFIMLNNKLMNTAYDFEDLEKNDYEFEFLQFSHWDISSNRLIDNPVLSCSVYYVHGYYEEDRDTACIPVGKIVLDHKLNPIFKFYMKNPQTPKKNDKAYKVSFEVKLTGCKADLAKARQQAGKLFKNYKQLILNSIDKPDHYAF